MNNESNIGSKNGVTKVVDWLLYSNLWIALNATVQVAQTQYLLDGTFRFTPILGLVFFGTLFIYAIHRVNGLGQLAPFTSAGRFKIISEHKRHILVYALIGLVGAAIFAFLLPWRIQLMLGLPGVIALGYVLPLGKSGKRLRDLHFIKIFLIAIVWGWLTVWVPAAEMGMTWDLPILLMALERAAFIFAITVPFDIRDLEVDQHTEVKTLPSTLGATHAIVLAIFALVTMVALAGWNAYTGWYSSAAWLGLTLSALFSIGLILYSRRVKHDYYFSGLLDGTMIIQFLLVWGCIVLFT